MAVRMDAVLRVGLGAPGWRERWVQRWRQCGWMSCSTLGLGHLGGERDGCSGSGSADGCGSVDSADECGALGRAQGTWVAAQMKAVLYFDLRAERERESAVEWRGRAVLTAASIHATATEWRLWKLGSLTARSRRKRRIGEDENKAAASLHGSGYATGQRGFDPSLCTSLTVQISEFSCDGAVRLTKCSRWEE